jgi:peptidoglycan hydrolase-like protein with peptidoglycan-binding domain
MLRSLAFVSAVLGASLATSTLAAQSTATTTQQPAAAPATKKSSAMHMKQDTTKTSATTKSSASASKSGTMKTHHAAWTKDQIKEAQQGLAKAGLYKGQPTGVYNKETQKAVRAYQKQNNMPVTGRLSDSLLTRLKSS